MLTMRAATLFCLAALTAGGRALTPEAEPFASPAGARRLQEQPRANAEGCTSPDGKDGGPGDCWVGGDEPMTCAGGAAGVPTGEVTDPGDGPGNDSEYGRLRRYSCCGHCARCMLTAASEEADAACEANAECTAGMWCGPHNGCGGGDDDDDDGDGDSDDGCWTSACQRTECEAAKAPRVDHGVDPCAGVGVSGAKGACESDGGDYKTAVAACAAAGAALCSTADILDGRIVGARSPCVRRPAWTTPAAGYRPSDGEATCPDGEHLACVSPFAEGKASEDIEADPRACNCVPGDGAIPAAMDFTDAEPGRPITRCCSAGAAVQQGDPEVCRA